MSLYKTVIGTTGNAYVTILDWLPDRMADKLLLLTNSGGSNHLKYRIRAYPAVDGANYVELWAETELDDGILSRSSFRLLMGG